MVTGLKLVDCGVLRLKGPGHVLYSIRVTLCFACWLQVKVCGLLPKGKTSLSRTEPWHHQQPLGTGRRMEGLVLDRPSPACTSCPLSWPCHPAVACEEGGSPQPVQQGGSMGMSRGQLALALRPGEGGFASQRDCGAGGNGGGGAGVVMGRRSSQAPER